MVLIHNSLWSCILMPGLDGYGNPMLIGAANRYNICAFCSKIAGVNIGRDVNTRQMSNMHRPIGIGQRRSNKISFIVTHWVKRFIQIVANLHIYGQT